MLQRLFIIQHPLKNCERVIRLCAVLLVSIITSDIIISKFRDSISPAYMAARHKECVTANCFWELKKKKALCHVSLIPDPSTTWEAEAGTDVCLYSEFQAS